MDPAVPCFPFEDVDYCVGYAVCRCHNGSSLYVSFLVDSTATLPSFQAPSSLPTNNMVLRTSVIHLAL
ncbi:hypothetical protein F5X98DRAFT_341495 [Xylaria grammica]|nr:hypothetical protein F5X98DRAFT_341495 [Xylaria grammica]